MRESTATKPRVTPQIAKLALASGATLNTPPCSMRSESSLLARLRSTDAAAAHAHKYTGFVMAGERVGQVQTSLVGLLLTCVRRCQVEHGTSDGCMLLRRY